MSDFALLGPIAIAVAIVGFFGFAFWWTRFGGGKVERERQERLDRERGPRVRAQGWRYDDHAEGDIRYRIHGATPRGLAWTIAYDSDHASSSSRPKLVFRVAALGQRPIAWQISDRKSFELVRSGVGRAIHGTVAVLLAGLSKSLAEQRDFMARARELPAGSRRFRERFVLCGTEPDAVHLIDAEVERMVLDWPDFEPSFTRRDNCFSATLGGGGLEVRIACDGPSFDVIVHLARLGQHLAERAAGR